MQCARCAKWRRVDPRSVEALRSNNFFDVLPTDLDWEDWLSGAGQRLARAQSLTTDKVDEDKGGVEHLQANAKSLVAPSTPEELLRGPTPRTPETPGGFGERTPEISDQDGLGERAPSDWELASEDEHASGATNFRVEFDDALRGLQGAGPLNTADREHMREAEKCEDAGRGQRIGGAMAASEQDVSLLAARRTRELAEAVRVFLI